MPAVKENRFVQSQYASDFQNLMKTGFPSCLVTFSSAQEKVRNSSLVASRATEANTGRQLLQPDGNDTPG